MSLDITNEKKGADYTWETADGDWDDRSERGGGAGPNKWETQSTIINKESKNNLSITNEGNPHTEMTIDEAEGTIDDADGTIDAPHITLVNESKN